MVERTAASTGAAGFDVANASDDEITNRMASILDGSAEGDEDADPDADARDQNADGEDEDTSVQAEGDTAPDDEASGDEDGGGKELAVTQAIEAPASWDPEKSATFAKLPKPLQQYVAQREAERERGVNIKLEETADARKLADAERQAAISERAYYLQSLQQLVVHVQTIAPNEYADIKTPADQVRVATTDPQRWGRYVARMQAIGMIQTEQKRIAELGQKDLEAHQANVLRSEAQKAAQQMPELADPVKGPAARREMVSYLREVGFDDGEISTIADARLVQVARDAAYGRKMRLASGAAAQRVKDLPGKPPKVVRPGEGERPTQRMSKRDLINFANNGSDDQIASALARFM